MSMFCLETQTPPCFSSTAKPKQVMILEKRYMASMICPKPIGGKIE